MIAKPVIAKPVIAKPVIAKPVIAKPVIAKTGTTKAVPLAEGFGADIQGVDLSQPVSDADRATIYRTFLDHRVIRLRGQDLAPDNVLDASRILGPDLEAHLFKQFHHPDTPLIIILSNRRDTKTGAEKGLKNGGAFWHHDVSYKPEPAKATMLYAVEVPDEGGDTIFCDMTRAYDELSDDLKDRIEGRTAIHNYGYLKREIFTSGQAEVPPDCRHPVVRTHPETGRKALYINPSYTVRIEGVEEAESDALKQKIFEHCLQEKYLMHYKWQAGDVVAWDNAASMHTATTDKLDPAKYRTLWRTIVSGGPTM
ncbi:MAG: TauD/TfdA family dioxygenase [Rhodospirillaceae bacterium]|nr:TauD/TfdA family dioxygenase [Rhodospirillaceae bacterium]